MSFWIELKIALKTPRNWPCPGLGAIRLQAKRSTASAKRLFQQPSFLIVPVRSAFSSDGIPFSRNFLGMSSIWFLIAPQPPALRPRVPPAEAADPLIRSDNILRDLHTPESDESGNGCAATTCETPFPAHTWW